MKWLLLALVLWVGWRMLAARAGREGGAVPGADGRPVVVIDPGGAGAASRRWLLGAALVGAASVFPLAVQWLLFTHGPRQAAAWAVALCWALPVAATLLQRALVPALAWGCAAGVLGGAAALAWQVWGEGGPALQQPVPALSAALFGLAALAFAVALLREAGVGAGRRRR